MKMKKINKRAARKAFEAGEQLLLYPCNIRPNNCWYQGVWIGNDFWSCQGETFDQIVGVFESYECNAETGRYAAYYMNP